MDSNVEPAENVATEYHFPKDLVLDHVGAVGSVERTRRRGDVDQEREAGDQLPRPGRLSRHGRHRLP